MVEQHVQQVQRLHRAAAAEWIPKTWRARLEEIKPGHYQGERHLYCYNRCVRALNRGRLGEPTSEDELLLEFAGIRFPRNREQADALARDLRDALDALAPLFDKRCVCWDLPIPPPSQPRCAQCREPAWPGDRYCRDCGHWIDTPRRHPNDECPVCGAHPVSRRDWYCYQCGERLPTVDRTDWEDDWEDVWGDREDD